MHEETPLSYFTLVNNRYDELDLLEKKKKINTFYNNSRRWQWWEHPKNLEFVYCIIGVLKNPYIYYDRIPNYLRSTKKWFNFIKSGSIYRDQFTHLNNYELFDFLCDCNEVLFLELYNEFNQNMGNPNEEERKKFIERHQAYLPKTTSGFNKGNVILDYNWRLSHQGHLSKYWRFVRNDITHKILECFLSNHNDSGKSNYNEIVLTKDFLLKILLYLPAPYQILTMFVCQSGLRISDALKCLLENWENLQKFEYIDDSGEKQERFYFYNIITKKRKRPIYYLFLSKEFTDLLKFLSHREVLDIEISLLLRHPKNNHHIITKGGYIFHHGMRSKTIFKDIKEKLRTKSNKYCISSHDLNKELKRSLVQIRQLNPDLEYPGIIRTQILRKFYITHTRRLMGEFDADYLRYMEGHTPLDVMFMIYNQDIRDKSRCLEIFVSLLEPNLEIGFTEIFIANYIERKTMAKNTITTNKQQIFDFFNTQSVISLLSICVYLKKCGIILNYNEMCLILKELQNEKCLILEGDYYRFSHFQSSL